MIAQRLRVTYAPSVRAMVSRCAPLAIRATCAAYALGVARWRVSSHAYGRRTRHVHLRIEFDDDVELLSVPACVSGLLGTFAFFFARGGGAPPRRRPPRHLRHRRRHRAPRAAAECSQSYVRWHIVKISLPLSVRTTVLRNLLEFRLSHHCTTGLDRAPCPIA